MSSTIVRHSVGRPSRLVHSSTLKHKFISSSARPFVWDSALDSYLDCSMSRMRSWVISRWHSCERRGQTNNRTRRDMFNKDTINIHLLITNLVFFFLIPPFSFQCLLSDWRFHWCDCRRCEFLPTELYGTIECCLQSSQWRWSWWGTILKKKGMATFAPMDMIGSRNRKADRSSIHTPRYLPVHDRIRLRILHCRFRPPSPTSAYCWPYLRTIHSIEHDLRPLL